MIIWIANPVLLHLGPFEIRWYALLFVIGMILAYRFSSRAFERDGAAPEKAEKLFAYVFAFGLIGARLGHTLFYEPQIYLGEPLRILKVWEGGLASHGAGLGMILAGVFFSRKYKLSFFFMADRVCIGFLLLGSFIRVGNLFNSEIVGRPTNVPWAMVFPRVDNLPRHPAQLYEAFFYLALFFILRALYLKTNFKSRPGTLFGLFLTCVFTFRFLVEFVKENQVAFEKNLSLNLGQCLSLPFIILGFFFLLRTPSGPVPQK